MLNPMEDRTVPAVFYWLGGGNNTFGTVGDWTLDPVNKAPAAGTPGAGDEAVYDGTVSSAVCAEVGAADPFGYTYLSSIAAIRAVNGYAGVLGFPRALSVGTFQMTSADAQTDQYTDLTVTGTFTWTGGTINLNTGLVNLILSGATATIAPEGGGTVTTGDNLNFTNGATGTITAGTINFNNGSVYSLTGTGTTLTVDTSAGDVNFQQPAPPPAPQPEAVIGQGTLEITKGGHNNPKPFPIVVAGEWDLIGGTTVNVTGGGSTQYSVSTRAVAPQSGLISIENGSTLQVANGVAIGKGGVLQSQPKPGAGQDQRLTFPAVLKGNLDLSGGGFMIDAGAAPHVWGTFNVTGNVNWTGGMFHVTVDPNAANLNFDQWIIDGTLNVTVTLDQNGNPVPGSPSVDGLLSPNNPPAKNQVWKGIIFAAGGITKTGPIPTADNGFTVSPEADGQTWDLQT